MSGDMVVVWVFFGMVWFITGAIASVDTYNGFKKHFSKVGSIERLIVVFVFLLGFVGFMLTRKPTKSIDESEEE